MAMSEAAGTDGRQVLRCAVWGALGFGLSGLAAFWVWTAFEFPFTVLLWWFAGFAVLGYLLGGQRLAAVLGGIGGVAYLVAFLVTLFFGLTDGSPLPFLEGPLSDFLAPALASAAVGGLGLKSSRAALVLAAAAGIGFMVPMALVPVLQGMDAQALAFALNGLLRGIAGGAALGAALGWLYPAGRTDARP